MAWLQTCVQVATLVEAAAVVIASALVVMELRASTHERSHAGWLDLMSLPLHTPLLEQAWLGLDPIKRESLRNMQRKHLKEHGKVGGAWLELSEDERRVYRFLRLMLEHFEFEFLSLNRGIKSLIGGSREKKLEQIVAMFMSAPLFEFVVADTRPRLNAKFCSFLWRIEKSAGVPFGDSPRDLSMRS